MTELPRDTDATDSHTSADPPHPQPACDRKMLESLVCPVTQGQLGYDSARQELISRTARLAFPIRNGIPIMLASEAREIDP